VTVQVERRSGRDTFHFENPSQFNPGPLEPHFFEQVYDTSAAWLTATVRYRLRGTAGSTEVGFAPGVTTAGSDVDTFFEPGGDVITSGTRGDVRLRSLAIEQRLGLTEWRRVAIGVTAGVRRATAEFLPADIVVTHTRPPSQSQTLTTDRERATVAVVETGFSARTRFDLTTFAGFEGPWRVTIAGELLPLSSARLRTSLPDKYPGQDNVVQALSFGVHGRASLERAAGRLSAGIGLTTEGAWSYGRMNRYHHFGLGVGAVVSLR
jgi:hypothetical protein